MNSKIRFAIELTDDIKQLVQKNYSGFIMAETSHIQSDISDEAKINQLIKALEHYKESLEHNISVLTLMQKSN